MLSDQIKTISNWLGTGSIDIFGCPFSGKDTQAHNLANLFNGVVIGGGEILRSHHDPKKIEQVLDSGGIVPSDFYLNLVLPYLSQPKFKEKPLILSTVGRSHGEEPIIMKAAADSGHPIKAAIVLQLPEDEVWRRFEEAKTSKDRGNRDDDRREVLKTRLKKFKDKTMPVIEFYRDKGLLIEIDGMPSRQEITNNILKSLLTRAT